ncbi:glycosyltransferase family 4 protein [Larsenimonas rhizosphaerae]|uniref:glycosyltransferase family 4 protein n=1 Tax=Larsenimonas rhizosphaerae TaxID=2944682 RepID=UPI0020348F9E|nr:glycosyltransferase family 4 protein [Larsenimonas rhizosphaerae]MCM2129323.1 glycosyltransferase family 4 protein [Larsenimonas rhizosphaerae]
MTLPLHIRHVNLARGFRGGERQTVLLIEQLAIRYKGQLTQSLVCRSDSELPERLADVDVHVIAAGHQLQGHYQGVPADIVHAHEAKGVHWAWVHHRLRRPPYLLTRRVPQPVRDKPFNRLTYSNASVAVAISSVIQRHLESRHWARTALIPSAYSHVPSDPKRVSELRTRFAGKTVIGHVGALVDRHKGQRVLLEAARRLGPSHPDVVFLLLGEGEDAQELRRESVDLENVTWEGFQPDVENYFDIMDIFAFPSRNEGLGSTLLDAIDHHVPIIASDVDGIPDIITHEKSGLLFSPGDASALTQGLDRMLTDPALCHALVQGADQRLVEFSPEAMADSYHALYHRILART